MIFFRELLKNIINNKHYKKVKDVNGNPITIYRGGDTAYTRGCFFSTDFETARFYGGEKPIIAANLKAIKPLIIDAKSYYYEHISYEGCMNKNKEELMPLFAKYRKELYLNNNNKYLSSDEYLSFALKYGYDVVIILNVREGSSFGTKEKITTDIAVTCKNNIINKREVKDIDYPALAELDLRDFI